MMNNEQSDFFSTSKPLSAEPLEVTGDSNYLTRQQLVKEIGEGVGVKIDEQAPADLSRGIEIVNPNGSVSYLDFSNPGVELEPGRPLPPEDEEIDGLTEDEIVKKTGLAGGMVLSPGKDYKDTHPFEDLGKD
jgi:hypothetical protein